MRHDGELTVQRRAGIVRGGIGSSVIGIRMPEPAREFLRQQRMLIVAARDDDGAVWASGLRGAAGFVHASGDRTIEVDALLRADDPLVDALDGDREIGAIAIEPATRRRMRMNGRVRRHGDGLVITADQVFANCPNYITPRVIGEETHLLPGFVPAGRTRDISVDQGLIISRADTFFVGTHVPGLGADASHRGGEPGFVTVTGPRTLSWPDYRGNAMYLTLGNLDLDSACGLLFPGWGGGPALQLTGHASIDWDPARAAAVPGAERMIDFEIDAVVEIAGQPRP